MTELTRFAPAPERYEWFEPSSVGFLLDRREFMECAGAGLLVLLILRGTAHGQDEESRPRRRQGGPSASEISAWIHVAENNQITAYTGKVELGQNIRTSLAQAVADELRVPMNAVRMVMADTRLTPFDMGTFGSMTTPVMARQLRRAAAAARELLMDMAAERWKIDREELTVDEGKVRHRRENRALSFGELTRGKKLVKAVGSDQKVSPAAEWRVAGTSVPKVDARGMVTGAHRYSSDIKRPGMLYGKIFRPAAFQATPETLNLEAARAVPGAIVVRDGDFVGVAAPDTHTAERALAAIQVRWKTVPQPSGQDLFDLLRKSGKPRAGGAVRNEATPVTKPDESAGRKLEATYTVAYIAHAPLEPRAAVAEWDGDQLTVWTGTQRPFAVRREVADAVKVPAERVRVIVPDTGSGYGGKHTGEAAVEAARLARAAGKPVKVAWTREEEFTWAYFRPAGVIEVRSEVSKDGMITAWEFHNYNSGGSAIRSPYSIANQHTEFHPARSPLRQGSYRALAATANHFARETHMDELAHAVGIDPLAFRLKNLKNARLKAVLETAAERFGWHKLKAPADHGFGIAGGFEKGSYVAACAQVSINRASGRVQVIRMLTAFDCGAIVNPEHLRNQIEGAAVMGLGGALFESVQFDNGRILNPRFSSYRVPRFADVPELDTVLVDRKDLPSAGAGETPIVAVAPAVGNAIFAAAGVRLRSLPMAPGGLKT